jgi:hypothetical protein
VTGLQVALDAKAAATHGHAIANVTSLQAALDTKAPTVHTQVLADLNIAGTPDGTKILRDDGTWASIAAGLSDMTAAGYDPQGIAADAFARANHTGEQAIGTITVLRWQPGGMLLVAGDEQEPGETGIDLLRRATMDVRMVAERRRRLN